MKHNPYKLRLAGESAEAIFVAFSHLSIAELREHADKLEGNDTTRMGPITAEGIRGSGVEVTLATGFALLMYRELTREEGTLFSNVIEDAGLTRTQAYRTIAVAERFGAILAKKPNLTKKFVPESLKMLSGLSVPDAAGDEAVEMALSGEQISMRVADEIRQRHGVLGGTTTQAPTKAEVAQQPEPSGMKAAISKPQAGPSETPTVTPQPRLEKPRKPWLSLIGKALSFIVEIKPDQKEPDLNAMITDTTHFLDKLKKAHALLTQKNNLKKAG